jgi:cytochrome bd-type quinol oxidase subunit 2
VARPFEEQLPFENPSDSVRAITPYCLLSGHRLVSQEETRLMCQGTLSRITFFFATSLWGIAAATLKGDDASPLVACGCLGFVAVVLVAIIALHIALLIWVMRDAKNRGMENAVVWMIVVILTGIIGLIIYLFTRPQGNLAPCTHCGNTRLEVSAKCPHCGNS